MIDLPPPPQNLSYQIDRDTKEMIACNLFDWTENANIAEEDDLLAFAKELRETFADGFQWKDLTTIVRVSREFMDEFLDMNEKQRRDGVIKIFDYFIDITDTPYLPDNITDPIFKALVPPFVDLTILAMNGEIFTKVGNEYATMTGRPQAGDMNLLFTDLKSMLSGEFSWNKVCDAMQKGLAFAHGYVDLNRDELKETTYQILAFIVDVTPWPYGLDPVLDPVTKVIMSPIIDLVFDAI